MSAIDQELDDLIGGDGVPGIQPEQPSPDPLRETSFAGEDPRRVRMQHPLTGRVIDTDDPDELIDLFEELKEIDGRLYVAKIEIQRSLAARCENKKKTERVAGRRRVARIEHPSTTWNNAKLKEVWNSYPELAPKYLRIESVAPQLREVDKLRGTSGPPDLETVKKMILDAEQQPTANPRLTIET